jgi:hypothetical protein
VESLLYEIMYAKKRSHWDPAKICRDTWLVLFRPQANPFPPVIALYEEIWMINISGRNT